MPEERSRAPVPGVCRAPRGALLREGDVMTDDGLWTVSATPLGGAPGPASGTGAVVDLVVAGSLGGWLAGAAGPVASGEWRALGDGRYAVVLHLGGVEVDAVLRREGDAYVGRAAARPVPGSAPSGSATSSVATGSSERAMPTGCRPVEVPADAAEARSEDRASELRTPRRT